jgi:hypothetical protein
MDLRNGSTTMWWKLMIQFTVPYEQNFHIAKWAMIDID